MRHASAAGRERPRRRSPDHPAREERRPRRKGGRTALRDGVGQTQARPRGDARLRGPRRLDDRELSRRQGRALPLPRGADVRHLYRQGGLHRPDGDKLPRAAAAQAHPHRGHAAGRATVGARQQLGLVPQAQDRPHLHPRGGAGRQGRGLRHRSGPGELRLLVSHARPIRLAHGQPRSHQSCPQHRRRQARLSALLRRAPRERLLGQEAREALLRLAPVLHARRQAAGRAEAPADRRPVAHHARHHHAHAKGVGEGLAEPGWPSPYLHCKRTARQDSLELPPQDGHPR